jgi:hypothetical protein
MTCRSWIALTLVSFVACSSSADDEPGPGPPTVRIDARIGPPDPADAPPPTVGGGGLPGVIVLAWSGDFIGGFAGFASTATVEPSRPCTSETIQACTIKTCPSPADAPDALEASAGTIVISGGTEPVVMKPAALLSGGYDVTDGFGARLVDGQTVTVAADGGDVPAFSGVAAKVPTGITVGGDFSLIDTSQDLHIFWGGGGADGKVVARFSSDDSTTVTTATCEFDGLAGEGTVPMDVWQRLAPCPSDGGPVCTWQVVPQVVTHFVAGDWSVDFLVMARGAVGLYHNDR